MENLGIDPKLIVAQLINFLLFLFVFKKFLAKPFASFVAKEKKEQEEHQAALIKSRQMEERIEKQEKDFKEKMKKEQATILDEAKREAEAVRKQLLDEAHAEAAEVRTRSLKQLEQEKAELEEAAKEHITRVGMLLVQEALDDVLTDDMKKKITDNIIKNSGKRISLS
ncbi:hypothetical protein HYS00_03435 [Candidatus Microgenomates bacterium]|nr:hypothetical protein [Candidatus Microgenomates bacterium]